PRRPPRNRSKALVASLRLHGTEEDCSCFCTSEVQILPVCSDRIVLIMGARSQLWSIAKMSVTGGVIGVTISDRYVTVVAIKGHSMHPTMTATDSALRGDIVLAEKACLDQYKFSRGDVILFKCPSNHKEVFVKRLIGLPGEWIQLPASSEIIKVPQGHCWVEGDNAARSWDSRSFGPIPLGLINGRVTHIIWPPSKIGRVERKWPEDRIPPF
uniref:Mitochondrial inner membrane protease subunit 2 n=1 Tax=Aegilops tauschii subsp. strangulata TaxID=200361 RepID=A0A453J107_AEGTS